MKVFSNLIISNSKFKLKKDKKINLKNKKVQKFEKKK